MRFNLLILSLVCLSFLSFGLTQTVNAQYNIETAQSSVSVNISPESPGPNQTVSVGLESYAVDLNSSTITWKVNGKVIKKGIGLKSFSFKTGDMNVNTELVIAIVTRQGEYIENRYNFKPATVDLIWQSNGVVPPFYKGKVMFSHQNTIEFIAMPHITGKNGQEIPAGNLIYKWTKDGNVLGDSSGYGMKTYKMIGSIISRPITVKVEVSSPDSGGVGSAETTVTPTEPTIIMYEKSPLYGVQFQKTLSGASQLNSSKEITVVAVPLFFGVNSATSRSLSYKWSINGKSISNGTDPASRVFRQTEESSGRSYISLSIENSQKVLQYASQGFYLNFGDSNK